MSAFVFTPARGGDPEVLDVWDPSDDSRNLGVVYQYRRGSRWSARYAATGYPDQTGFVTREAAARWLQQHQKRIGA